MSSNPLEPDLKELEQKIRKMEQTIESTAKRTHMLKMYISLLLMMIGAFFLFNSSTSLLGILIAIAGGFLLYQPTTASDEASEHISRNVIQQQNEYLSETVTDVDQNEITAVTTEETVEHENISLAETTATYTADKIQEPEIENIPLENISETHDENTTEFSLEARIGIKWSSILGIAALVLGIGFLIKYAIDAGWIGYTIRIIFGVLLGISMMIGGYYLGLREKYKNLGRTIMAGGFAITYFATYASYYFEPYRIATGMSELTVALFLGAIAAAGTGVALRMNSKIIVSEGFLLGYMTSLLSVHFSFLSLLYCALLSFSLLGVTYYKKWSQIGFAGMLVTYATYFFTNLSSSYSLFQGGSFLTLFFVTFVAQSFLLELEKKDEYPIYSSGMVLNGLLYGGLFMQLIQNYSAYIQGGFLLILGVIYGIQSFFARKKNNQILTQMAFYLAVFFATLSLTYFLEGASLIASVLLEAVLGLFLYKRTQEKPWIYSSLILSILSLAATLVIAGNLVLYPQSIIDVSTIIMILLGAPVSFIFHTVINGNTDRERNLSAMYGISGILISYMFLYIMLHMNAVYFNAAAGILTLLYVIITKGLRRIFRYNAFLIFTLLAVKTSLDFLIPYNLNISIEIHRLLLMLAYILPSGAAMVYMYSKRALIVKNEHSFLYLHGLVMNAVVLFWLILLNTTSPWYLLGYALVVLYYLLPGVLIKDNTHITKVAVVSLLALAMKYIMDTIGLQEVWKVGVFSGGQIIAGLSYMLPAGLFAYYLSKRTDIEQQTTLAYLLSWSVCMIYFVCTFVELHTLSEYYALLMFTTSGILIGLSKSSWKSLYEESVAAFALGILTVTGFIFHTITWSILDIPFYMAVGSGILFSYFLAYMWSKIQYIYSTQLTLAYTTAGSILVTLFLGKITQDFMISASWSLFALILIYVGLSIQNRVLRWHGIILFAMTIGKIMLIDLNNFDPIYRILSFIALGIFLLFTSFVYTKNREKFKDYF